MARKPADPVPVDKALRTVRVTMFAQAALSLLGGGFILYLLGLSEGSGDDTTGFGLLRAMSVVSMVLAVVLVVCAARLLHRLPWVRVTTLVIETVTVASGLVNLLTMVFSDGPIQPLAVVPLALGAMVIAPLLRRDVRDWFAASAPERPGVQGG